MATIITVHGTNASGPEDAEKTGQGHWWQRGSYFDLHIRQLVKSDDGELKIEPLLWDGSNSEIARHRAGKKLVSTVKDLEQRGETHCVVGHSHGGSIISHALLELAGRSPEHLKSWITVGTPFVHLRKQMFLFSRLNTPARAGYMILALYLTAIFLLPFYGAELGLTTEQTYADLPLHLKALFWVIIYLIGITLALPVYLLLSFLQPAKLKNYNKRRMRKAKNAFQSRWVGLWHKNDEAIVGLQKLHKVDIRPFGERFAANGILILAIFIVPLTLLIIASDKGATTGFLDFLGYVSDGTTDDLRELGGQSHFFHRFSVLLYILLATPARLLQYILPIHPAATFLAPALGIIALWLIALVIYLPFKQLSEWLSILLSKGLNQAARGQINSMALGSDTIGECPMYAAEYPSWILAPPNPLPEVLAQEISQVSDKAVAESIVRIRNDLNQLTFLNKEGNTDTVSEYLSWNELIHTTYFEVPRFRKLLAYAITQTDGFSPTREFETDPDFQLVAQWYTILLQQQPKGESV